MDQHRRPMAPARRTSRVFVSSTFEDLKAERDALQRDVFSRLRKRCEENSAFGQVLSRAIDMRWGVREASGTRINLVSQKAFRVASP